jgi:hypothetical protein
MKRGFNSIVWQEVRWHRPFQLADVLELLNHLATLSPRKTVVWEVRGSGGKVRYLVGTERRYVKHLKAAFTAHGNIEFSAVKEAERTEVTACKQLKVSKPLLSLSTTNTLAVLKTALAALTAATADETIVLQLVLGESFAPTPAPDKAPNPHATLLDMVRGRAGMASKDSLAVMKDKTNQHSSCALLRIGVKAAPKARANNLLLGLLSAFRLLEAPGVRLTTAAAGAETLNTVHIPWYLPLRLSVAELAALFLLPCGNTALAGQEALHPKQLRLPLWLKLPASEPERSFGVSLGANPVKLNIAPEDSLEHTAILGPTGSGKSTVLLNLVLADIRAGRGVLVIDPKADLVNDILARVPQERADDVVVIDPSDACPVGLNPLVFHRQATPCLISDSILAVFKQIYSDSWGVRSQDVLSAALLTLAQTDNATLLQLPALLTDRHFRQTITRKLNDQVGLEPFWAQFEAVSQPEQRQVIAPVMNKLRQFLLRPALRNVFGQVRPKFALSDLFESNKIVLVPLNKGLIGAESARLLGSLIVGLAWTLALARTDTLPEQRNTVSIFIDELQDYLALPIDFAEALSQARGLGVGFTVAHQYRAQLSPAIRAAVDANARNKIVFGLNAADAKETAAMAPSLEPMDFMSLPRYQIYTSLQHGGKSTGWLSGKTLPAPPTLRLPVELKAASMRRYGQNPADTEAALTNSATPIPIGTIGRKKVI